MALQRQEAVPPHPQHPEGATTVQEASSKHDLAIAEVEKWKERFWGTEENALWRRLQDEEELKNEQIKRLKQKVGELMDLDKGQQVLHFPICDRGDDLPQATR